jgi:hypothetical protein
MSVNRRPDCCVQRLWDVGKEIPFPVEDVIGYVYGGGGGGDDMEMRGVQRGVE